MPKDVEHVDQSTVLGIPPTPKPQPMNKYQCPRCATWNKTADEPCARCKEEDDRAAAELKKRTEG